MKRILQGKLKQRSFWALLGIASLCIASLCLGGLAVTRLALGPEPSSPEELDASMTVTSIPTATSEPEPSEPPTLPSGADVARMPPVGEPPNSSCEGGDGCMALDNCRHRDERCAEKRDDRCAASDACKREGKCVLTDGHCTPGDNAHCAASEGCRTLGNCALQGGLCLPAAPEHCQASEGCAKDGTCYWLTDDLGPRCGIESHADCTESHLCREEERCYFAPHGRDGSGRCIKTTLASSQRFRLTSKRHGINGELLVRVDPKLLMLGPEPEKHGYRPDPLDPLAAAAIQLRALDGSLQEELTVYPDLSLSVQDLGTGTDTFLATEHVSCDGEHWCGPIAWFLEVRDGQLRAIDALGPRGETRSMRAIASRGSRWKLEKKPRSKVQDLVVQVEGLVPPGPAFIETRFTFDKTRYRFIERRAFVFAPGVAKQPGQWHGALELHGAR